MTSDDGTVAYDLLGERCAVAIDVLRRGAGSRAKAEESGTAKSRHPARTRLLLRDPVS